MAYKAMYQAYTVLFTLLLIGCGTTLKSQPITSQERTAEVQKQLEIALLDRFEVQSRFERVAAHVFQASAPMCGTQTKKYTGLILWNNSTYKGNYKKAAEKAFGLTKAVQIAQITPQGPAAQAGLNFGDTLLKINNTPITTGQKGLKTAKTLLANIMLANTTLNKKTAPIAITYKRDGTTHTTYLTLKDICDYGITYEDSDIVNAYADGKKIILTRGIIEFTRTDAELALIIGHELAHNVLKHIEKRTAQASAGTFGGLLLDLFLAGATGTAPNRNFSNLGGKLAAQAYAPQYEAEADYMGLYATARAGYNIEKAPYLWRRMGARNTKAIAVTTTHPATAERFIALEKTVKEIVKKQMHNTPLVPDTKNKI